MPVYGCVWMSRGALGKFSFAIELCGRPDGLTWEKRLGHHELMMVNEWTMSILRAAGGSAACVGSATVGGHSVQ